MNRRFSYALLLNFSQYFLAFEFSLTHSPLYTPCVFNISRRSEGDPGTVGRLHLSYDPSQSEQAIGRIRPLGVYN